METAVGYVFIPTFKGNHCSLRVGKWNWMGYWVKASHYHSNKLRNLVRMICLALCLNEVESHEVCPWHSIYRESCNAELSKTAKAVCSCCTSHSAMLMHAWRGWVLQSRCHHWSAALQLFKWICKLYEQILCPVGHPICNRLSVTFFPEDGDWKAPN